MVSPETAEVLRATWGLMSTERFFYTVPFRHLCLCDWPCVHLSKQISLQACAVIGVCMLKRKTN